MIDGLGAFDWKSLTWWHYGGFCTLSAGLAILALMYIILRNTQFVRVPEGEDPAAYYRQWKRKKLKERISKPGLAIMGSGVFLALIGAAVVAWGWLS